MKRINEVIDDVSRLRKLLHSSSRAFNFKEKKIFKIERERERESGKRKVTRAKREKEREREREGGDNGEVQGEDAETPNAKCDSVAFVAPSNTHSRVERERERERKGGKKR